MRLVSYNIHKGIGGRDRRYRLERIVAVLEREQADLFCLQEVDRGVRRSAFDNQPKILGDYFAAAGRFYQKNVFLKSGGYGNLILSRWPLKARHRVSLRFNRKKPRGAQVVVVETPEGPLHLINWHLGLAERERHWQVRHLLGSGIFRQFAHLPTMIAGDFNDWRNTLAAGPFAEHRFEQVTAPISRFRSFPAYLPMGSLDKAFTRGLHVGHVRVPDTQDAKTASDHRPLVIDFRLH